MPHPDLALIHVTHYKRYDNTTVTELDVCVTIQHNSPFYLISLHIAYKIGCKCKVFCIVLILIQIIDNSPNQILSFLMCVNFSRFVDRIWSANINISWKTLVENSWCRIFELKWRLRHGYRYASAFSCLDDSWIFSPDLKAGIPRYGQLEHRKASPR